jgi:hypothetical protein
MSNVVSRLRAFVLLPAALLAAAPARGQERGAGEPAADAPGAGDRGPAELEELRRLRRATDLDRAVDRGLAWLIGAQGADGAFGKKYPIALTSLSVLAFLARGHLPADGSVEGKAAARGLEYVLAERRQRDDGYFGIDGSQMYGHAITVLMLAEVLGMGVSDEQERRILAALEQGLALLLRAQAVEKAVEDAGGWRYHPDSPDSDLSITVWAVTALRAAQNAGLEVPREAIARAVAYVRKRFQRGDGWFAYRQGEDPALPITAAGLLGLQVAGVYSGREVEAAADRLLRETPEWRQRGWFGHWFYYGVYYYAQAMHQVGGKHAETAREALAELLYRGAAGAAAPPPSAQLPDGSWPGPPGSGQEREAGPVYTTAMAVLALSVEYRLLPIYQR